MNEFKKLIVTIILFAVVGLALTGWLYTQMAHVGWQPFDGPDSLATKIQKTNDTIAIEQEKIDQIPGAEKELEQLQRDEKLANQLLPSENDPAQLLRFIWNKAEEVGVGAERVKPAMSNNNNSRRGFQAAGGAEDRLEEWTYDMVLKGTYDQIAQFINKMEEFEIRTAGDERQKRFFMVKNLQISSAGALIEGDAIHTAQLTMATYRYRGDK